MKVDVQKIILHIRLMQWYPLNPVTVLWIRKWLTNLLFGSKSRGRINSVVSQNLLEDWSYCFAFNSLTLLLYTITLLLFFFLILFRLFFYFSAAFKTVIILFPLLGLCWFFGIVGVMTINRPFIYVFVVLSSLQVCVSFISLQRPHYKFLILDTLSNLFK